MRLLLLTTLTLFGPLLSARGWTELDGVVYEEEGYSDGDSFRARRNTRRYIFRLYFVDSPETDTRYPDRLQEQAEYFGVTVEDVIQGGEDGAKWLHNLLIKEPFAVYTKYTNARGSSDRRRYYAMVKIGDRWLSELLVEEGLVRVYGHHSELPDGTSSRNYLSRLRKLEEEAKNARKGIWATAAGRVNASRQVTLKVPTPIFNADPPHALVGQLPAGWEVTVGAVTRPGFRSVTFLSSTENTFTGEIQESSIPDETRTR